MRALAVAALLLVAGCDTTTTPDDGGGTDWQVVLRNANAAAVHILAAGEAPSGATLLAPGATRTVAVAPGARNDTRAFRSSFDGTTFDAIDCIILNLRASGASVEVTDAGGIVCLNW